MDDKSFSLNVSVDKARKGYWKNLGKVGSIYVKIYDPLDEHVLGIRNITNDGMYVVFLDYDDMELDQVEKEIRLLQEVHVLHTAYVFESSFGNHQVIFLDKIYGMNIVSKILESSSCDAEYWRSSLKTSAKRRELVLRVSRKGVKEKPKLVRVIDVNTTPKYLLSRAHYDWVRLHGAIALSDNNKSYLDDNYNGINLITYMTRSIKAAKRGRGLNGRDTGVRNTERED